MNRDTPSRKSSGSKLPYLNQSFDFGKGEAAPPTRELAKLVNVPKKPPVVIKEDK